MRIVLQALAALLAQLDHPSLDIVNRVENRSLNYRMNIVDVLQCRFSKPTASQIWMRGVGIWTLPTACSHLLSSMFFHDVWHCNKTCDHFDALFGEG